MDEDYPENFADYREVFARNYVYTTRPLCTICTRPFIPAKNRSICMLCLPHVKIEAHVVATIYIKSKEDDVHAEGGTTETCLSHGTVSLVEDNEGREKRVRYHDGQSEREEAFIK